MKGKSDNNHMKYVGNSWREIEEEDDVEVQKSFKANKQQKTKVTKFKDDSKDFNRGKKLNKRTYR
jgi:hypothetical protein